MAKSNVIGIVACILGIIAIYFVIIGEFMVSTLLLFFQSTLLFIDRIKTKK